MSDDLLNMDVQIERLSVITVQPGDLILVQISRHLPEISIMGLSEVLRKTFPSNNVIVFDNVMQISVVRESDLKQDDDEDEKQDL